MSRLHKISKFPLIKKYYLTFFLLIIFGIYKNGLHPYFKGFNNLSHTIWLIVLPIISFLIGAILDKISKNHELFNCKFFSILMTLIIPISSNLLLYLIFLIILLIIYSYYLVKKTKNTLNFLALGKLIFIGFLYLINSLNYQNILESSNLFQYTIFDNILGYQISGIYTSSIILIIIALCFLSFDTYYKRRIPITSYGIYLLSIVTYSIIKQDLSFLLINSVSSTILFALVFIAPLSIYTPLRKKGQLIYSILIGLCILPFSLLINFYEGIYLAVISVNILMNLLIKVFKKQNLL